jgi:hypothetical protein
MPENTSLYQKYAVRRADGQPDRPGAAYFVLDVVNDPNAIAALTGYRISCADDFPDLALALRELEQELQTGRRDGPMVQALRLSRPPS